MNLDYCAAQVRAQDLDRFHLALCAPLPAQPSLLALAAFNLELARTAQRVTNADLGRIRLQWWRDVVASLGTSARAQGHQVAKALATIATSADTLDLRALNRMIDGREADLCQEPFATMEALRAYLAQTSGSLLVAQGRALGLAGHEGLANHLGCAFGFVGLARALAGGQAQTLRGLAGWHDAPADTVADLAAQAQMHLDRARELGSQTELSQPLFALSATAHLVRRWLRALTRLPLGSPAYVRPLPLQLLRLSWRRQPL